MNKKCKQCNKEFEITNSDFEFYKRIEVPEPTLCPDCRHQRRCCYRNEKNFYSRKCDLCGKAMVSVYPEDVKFPVYCNDCFWSDKWDPAKYAQEVDYSRPFFQQFHELSLKVPHITLINSKSENSDYTNYSTQNRNCYMCSGTGRAENCYHSNRVIECTDCISCFDIFKCELCYECIQCTNCFSVKNSQQCLDSNNIEYCYNCTGCSDCFGCVGLKNEKYFILNKEYSEDEYRKKVAEHKNNLDKFIQEFENLKIKIPRKYARLINCEKSDGNHLENCNTVRKSFMCKDCENVKYGHIVVQTKDHMDFTVGDKAEIGYEVCGQDTNNSTFFSTLIWFSQFTWYCQYCFNSKFSFGCVSLKKNQYTILNKSYDSEQAFNREKEKLIEHMKKTGEWGEYFPVSMAHFPYNDSIAHFYYPLTKKEVVANGWKWRDDKTTTKGKETIALENLPAISDIDESFVKNILACKKCKTNYKFINSELDLLKSLDAPIPQLCPTCRYREHIKKLDPFHLWHRRCMKPNCYNEFETTYSPQRKEMIYCDQCYRNEVY